MEALALTFTTFHKCRFYFPATFVDFRQSTYIWLRYIEWETMEKYWINCFFFSYAIFILFIDIAAL